MSKKNWLVLILALLAIALVLCTVYIHIDQRVTAPAQSREHVVGEIETGAKLWLNGYLGVLFRFKYLGNINWLIIPLAISFFVSRKPQRQHWALLFVGTGVFVLLAFKGYANPRYQVTLFPFTSVITLLLLWEFLRDKKKYFIIISLVVVAGLSIFNIIHYSNRFGSYWETRVAVSRPHFPHRLINHINTQLKIDHNNRVLVVNQPIYYYHTDKKGIDYTGPEIKDFWHMLIQTKGSRNGLYRHLKRKLKVRYLLFKTSHLRFYKLTMLAELLHCDTRLEMEDSGWQLFRLEDDLLVNRLQYSNYKKLNVWFRNKKALKKLSPALHRVTRTGFFDFKVKKLKKYKRIFRYITVRCLRKKEGKDPQILLGYELNRRGLDHPIPTGKYVTFIVNAAVPAHLLNRKNSIQVIDFDGKNWERDLVEFSSSRFRTYKVTRKIGPNAKRVIMAIRFMPKYEKDTLKIMSARILISDEPI